MIALDTNVLLRYILQDDSAQQQRAEKRIDRAAEVGARCFVSDVVLVEIAWVLKRAHGADRRMLLAVLASLYEARHMEFESSERVARALKAFAGGRGDFPDYLIRERAAEQGCEVVVTFDKNLLREDGFVAP